MRAALVVTGTEVLEGRVQDENGPALAAVLTECGMRMSRITVVGDSRAEISGVVADALASSPDLLVITGGLGPTHDDRTMEAVAHAAGVAVEVHPAALDMVRRAQKAVPARVPGPVRERGAHKQATLPVGATVIPPPGTAPGAVLRAGATVIVVLPGPPWECMAAWRSARGMAEVASVVGAGATTTPLRLRLAGVVESEFIDATSDDHPEAQGLVVGVCARPAELEVTVRPRGVAADVFVADLDRRFPGAIFSRDGSEVEEVIGRLLVARGQAVGTAESCTGGSIGARLTSVPGSSAWYAGGVVSYSDAVKAEVLRVPGAVLSRHGAVSADVAAAMATGAIAVLGCDWSVSVSGIAGPGGGSATKPVGLVYVGVAGPGGVEVREHHLHGDRERIRLRSSAIALHMLRTALAG